MELDSAAKKVVHNNDITACTCELAPPLTVV